MSLKHREMVTLTNKDSDGEDEVYGEWFTCPKCGESLIADHFSYCPGCGRKIIWRVKEDPPAKPSNKRFDGRSQRK